jgi:hypothetical protein
MDFRKIQSMGGGESAGLSLPKEQLREMGVIDEDGGVADVYARIERVGRNEFSLELIK